MSAYENVKKAVKNPEETKKLIQWMFSTAWPYKGTIFIIFLISLTSVIVSYASTIAGKYIVDDATNGLINIRNMSIMALTMLASILISIGSRILSSYVSERFSFKLRVQMYDDIQRSVWLKISTFHSGDLVTRLTSDISSLSDGLISFVPNLILVGFQLLIALGILFYYDPTMALMACIIGPFGALCFLVFRKQYGRFQKDLRQNESEYRSFMQESLTHLTVMKTFQQEDNNYNKLDSYRSVRLNLTLKSSTLMSIMNAMMNIVFNAGYILTFCWGAYRISTGSITYGTMTIFISLVSRVQNSLVSMASMVTTVYGMFISGKRLYDVVQMEKEEYKGYTSNFNTVGIEVKNLNFTYGRETILKDLNFIINPGEKVGIVGESGVGKTTLIRNLLALVKPNTGSITYFSNSLKEQACEDSRRFISYVPQGNTLISGTIKENLFVGKEDASEEEMWKALEISDASTFIKKLPDGLDTVLSEKAGGLSEGQAQRISIARAIISNKPLLILDEATSALDQKTEERILSKLNSNYPDKTCLIITHRRSMLKYCDKVIEIEEGKMTLKEL